MVCPRCLTAVQGVFYQQHITLQAVALGKVEIAQSLTPAQREKINQALTALGFELLDDRQAQLINAIKTIIIREIHYREDALSLNYSSILAQELHYDYAHLSRLFSSVEGRTIERYVMVQKIEKVKELLTYQELTLSEIAHQMDYSSSAHLSAQFKKVTGMTPTAFKKMQQQDRHSLDAI